MKSVFKKSLLWLGFLILALILFSLLLPKEVTISRSITVSAPIDRVFDQVNDLRNWEKWSPWKRMDP
ncbi:MAG: SRPBCC family protein, partial [Saprospiraceae bacterium]